MDIQELTARAKEAGFDRVYTRAPQCAPRKRVHRLNREICDDPREILPDVQTVILLVRGYRAFRSAAEEGKGPMISAYYIESQAAYIGAKAIAEWIRAQGFEALSNAPLAVKPLLEKCGIGRAGRNSLIAIPGLGSRFHVQVILTDAALPEYGWEEAGPDLCQGCEACVRACPTGAILPGGIIDIDTCLRARGEGEVVPREMRHLYNNRLLGCEICQNVCPRNAGDVQIDMPRELSDTLALRKLLRGELGELPDLIGRNYARKTRIRMKAALVAGNLRREDVKEELTELAENGEEREKEYARWALKRLEEEP